MGGAGADREPHCPRAKTGRPPMPVKTMLRIHYLHVYGPDALCKRCSMLRSWSASMCTACLLGSALHARSLDEIRASSAAIRLDGSPQPIAVQDLRTLL